MIKTKRNDLILIACILVIGIIGIVSVEWYKSSSTSNGEAVVFVDGKETGRYPLNVDTEVRIEGVNGYNYLIIRSGKAWIEEADCPDKICIYHGKIHKNGETLVCLPNKVVVEVQNGEENEVDISTN